MTQHGEARLTFFLDVDNTLIDNDAAKDELDHRLKALLGDARSAAFWQQYELVRGQAGMVDIPLTIHQLFADDPGNDLRFALADLVMQFPYADFLFPHAIETIHHLRTLGKVAILSDGDPVFQTAKIARSGLNAAVDGYALVFPHKEEHLPAVTTAFPADRYVLVDDKPTVIEAVRQRIGRPFTTVFVRHGRYAAKHDQLEWQAPDLTISTIGELRALDRAAFTGQ